MSDAFSIAPKSLFLSWPIRMCNMKKSDLQNERTYLHGHNDSVEQNTFFTRNTFQESGWNFKKTFCHLPEFFFSKKNLRFCSCMHKNHLCDKMLLRNSSTLECDFLSMEIYGKCEMNKHKHNLFNQKKYLPHHKISFDIKCVKKFYSWTFMQ